MLFKTPLPFLVFLATLVVPLSSSAAELSTGKDFRYGLDSESLVAWTDVDYPEGMIGTKVTFSGEGIAVPTEVIRGVHVGPFGFDAKDKPDWLDSVEMKTSWAPSEQPHCLDLTISVRNKTNKRFSFSGSPLAVWMGPFGTAEQGRYSLQTVYGSDGTSYEKLEDGEKEKRIQWVANTDRYRAFVMHRVEGLGNFVVRSVPAKQTDPEGNETAFQTKVLLLKIAEDIRGQEEFDVKVRIFMGLKRGETLKAAGYPKIYDTWGGWFGWLAFLAFQILTWFYGMTKSWGASILLLTLFVKLLLHPLSKKQYESMELMKEIQPKVEVIKTRYSDNPQRMQAEIGKLWQESGVNPLSGCLPLFMQMPIFIALYNCLGYAPELRGQEFLWLTDLSKSDPMLILPLLFAFGIYVSSSQSSASSDPSQKMMMQIMPVMMFFFMQGIPSGVMLYLAGQTLLSIFEQKSIRGGAPPPKAATTPSAPGAERTIDHEDAKAAAEEKAGAGNKYKKNRKGRR